MTDESSLLAAILAEPDSDRPRLLYADWLEERGDPRGEFIRVQCLRAGKYAHHAENGHEHADCKGCQLRRRERELLELHGTNWLPLQVPYFFHAVTSPGIIGQLWRDGLSMSNVFRCGFVESIDCTAAAWLAHGDALIAAAPIREVTLTTWPEVEVEDVNEARGRCRFVGTDCWYSCRPSRTTQEAAKIAFAARWPSVKTWMPDELAVFAQEMEGQGYVPDADALLRVLRGVAQRDRP